MKDDQIKLKNPQQMFQEGDKGRIGRYQDLCSDPDFQRFVNEVFGQYSAMLFSRTPEESALTDARRRGANEFSQLLITFPFPSKKPENQNTSGKLTY